MWSSASSTSTTVATKSGCVAPAFLPVLWKLICLFVQTGISVGPKSTLWDDPELQGFGVTTRELRSLFYGWVWYNTAYVDPLLPLLPIQAYSDRNMWPLALCDPEVRATIRRANRNGRRSYKREHEDDKDILDELELNSEKKIGRRLRKIKQAAIPKQRMSANGDRRKARKVELTAEEEAEMEILRAALRG